MNGIYLLLGSNLGNRLAYLQEAEALLIEQGIEILDESSIYETQPWGEENQDWFLNVILQIATSLSAEQLLQKVLLVEERLGRVRKVKWGERCIDIDILYFNGEQITSESLTVPHPGIPDRKFTLIPLAEMCPLERHPGNGKSQMEMLAECTDPLDCRLTDYKL